MKLITSNGSLLSTLSRLTENYPSVAFAVAWATANTSIFRTLLNEPSKITKAVIGTHFYQTHPDVLDAFVGSPRIRFILQPKGVFHPKIYLFYGPQGWEALIGSANLTLAALKHNSEVMVLISDSDHSASSLKEHVTSTIGDYWQAGKAATKASALAYRNLWIQKQPLLRSLSGEYGKTKSRRVPTDSSVMSMSWHDFLTSVRKEKAEYIDERCGLLGRVKKGFLSHKNFRSMELGLRQTVAGVPNDYDAHWGWFGSMKGAGSFWHVINENNVHLSRALDNIPLEGRISRNEYEAYLREFVKAFPNGRDGIATASRLLALKRPDHFVCLDSRNQGQLCVDFGIKTTNMSYERYWEEIIQRIMDSPWWNAPRPAHGRGSDVWDGRVAMLDSIFYKHRGDAVVL